MRKFVPIAALLLLVAGAALIAGCGGDKAEAATCAGCGAEIDAAHAKTIGGKMYCDACAVKAAGEEVAARHDCAGGCGMKDVPEDQLTQIDGKWYCKGCAAKLEAEGHEHAEGEGHDHG